jgi:phytoene synthase
VSGAELDAAGILEPDLREAYTACRALNAHHGRTYFLATRLLPRARRPAVHALYGFARYADEIVDDLADDRSSDVKAARLDALADQLTTALDGGPAAHPVLAALADTARRYGIDRAHFVDFLASMRMDTEITDYSTFAELDRYVHGSAAVIGLQMLPILGTTGPRADAEPAAAALGVAFQLTNFLRDVVVDWRLDRVYLPGLPEDALRTRTATAAVRERVAHHVGRARALFAETAPATDALTPAMRPGIRVARGVYARVLDQVERNEYDVIGRRAALAPWEGVRAGVGSVFAPR